MPRQKYAALLTHLPLHWAIIAFLMLLLGVNVLQ